MKSRLRIVSGLAALAALFLAPLADASLTRLSSPAIETPASTLATPAAAPEPSEFSLFDGTEIARAAAESERAPSFHPLAAVSLLSKDGAEAPLVSVDELIYPKTRYRVFGLLGTPILGVERGLSLELRWGCADFSCGLASGTVGWLSQDPLGDKDSPNLYGFVGMRPHEKTDPLGLARRTANGGVNPLADTLSDDDLSWWGIAKDAAGNTLTDMLGLDTIADSSAVTGDSTRSVGERAWAATKGLGTAAFDVAGGEILGTAGRVLTKVPGAGKLISKVAGSKVGKILAKDVGKLGRGGSAAEAETAAARAQLKALRPNAKGKVGQGWSYDAAIARGEEIAGEEVDLIFTINGQDVAVRADVLTKLPGEDTFVYIESKFSKSARYQPHQKIVIPELVKSGDAGLIAKVGARPGNLTPGAQIKVVFQGDVWDGIPTLLGQ